MRWERVWRELQEIGAIRKAVKRIQGIRNAVTDTHVWVTGPSASEKYHVTKCENCGSELINRDNLKFDDWPWTHIPTSAELRSNGVFPNCKAQSVRNVMFS